MAKEETKEATAEISASRVITQSDDDAVRVEFNKNGGVVLRGEYSDAIDGVTLNAAAIPLLIQILSDAQS